MKKCALVLLAALTVVSCSKDDKVTDNTRKYIDMTGHYNELSVANSDLAFDLFAAVNENVGENGKPILLSPVSLSLTLGMLNNGAANGTRDTYMSILGGDYADIDEMNEFYHTLVSQFPKLDNTAKVKIANSQWSVSDFKLLSSYSKTISDYFDADIYTLKLSSAASDINNWCSKNTEGLIKDFYSSDEITEDTKTVLLDALYFKGVWKDKFYNGNTFEDKFTNYDGSESTVSYMHKTLSTSCYENDYYAVMSLPFGNEAFSMQIVLPNEDVSLTECINSLNTDVWRNWKGGTYRDYDLLLPKFTVEYKKSLDDILGQMGLESALKGGDYSNMSESSFDFLKIKQATFFTIDEEGAEAAAVTGGSGEASAGPSESGEFHVNRPFLYVIKENSSNTILFIGRVTEL